MERWSVSDYFRSIFDGKVQKIAVDAALGCPNRDGSCGTGGCIFCNNAAFSPRYALGSTEGITAQLTKGTAFFARKGNVSGYLPYFQTYSNTYGRTEHLISLYEEALRFPRAKGLVIATRPDCLAPDLLDYFEERFGAGAPQGHPFLLMEIGIESTIDSTLELINRGHDYECSRQAVIELDRRGIATGAHIILGLPGETESDFMLHAERLSELPLKTLKLHHLQIVRDTPLEKMYLENPDCVHLFTPQEYAEVLRKFLSRLRADIAIDRVVSETPQHLITAPCWGIKPIHWGQTPFTVFPPTSTSDGDFAEQGTDPVQ